MFYSSNFNEIISDIFGPDIYARTNMKINLTKLEAILFAQVAPPDYLLITFLILKA